MSSCEVLAQRLRLRASDRFDYGNLQHKPIETSLLSYGVLTSQVPLVPVYVFGQSVLWRDSAPEFRRKWRQCGEKFYVLMVDLRSRPSTVPAYKHRAVTQNPRHLKYPKPADWAENPEVLDLGSRV